MSAGTSAPTGPSQPDGEMSLIDHLLPPRCLLCGDPGADGLALCPGCRTDLPRNDHACARCAEPLAATAGSLPELQVCGACLWHPPPYAAIHVPFRYAAPMDWIIRRFKFHGDLAAGRLLGQLLAAELTATLEGCGAVVPIPLHPGRLRTRGYNQAAELGRPLARALGVPLCPRALARTGSVTPQMELPARERGHNVRRAFRVRQLPASGHILILDDVVTTASTVREAVSAAGLPAATRVEVGALARA